MSTQSQQSARDILQSFVDSEYGGFSVVYRRQSGETISTICIEDREVKEFGDFDSSAQEWRTAFDLLVEDVGQPCRGDTLILSDDRNFSVQDVIPGGDVDIVRVAVK